MPTSDKTRASVRGMRLSERKLSELSLIGALRRLSSYVSAPHRRQGLIVLSLMVLGAFAELLTIGAVIPFISLVAAPEKIQSYPAVAQFLAGLGLVTQQQLITMAAIGFSAVAIGAAGLRLVLAKLSQSFIFTLGYDISSRVYDTILRQPFSYHLNTNTSSALAGIQKCTQLTSTLLLPLMQGIIAGVVSLFILMAMLWADPLIAIVSFLGFGGVYLAVSTVARSGLRRNGAVMAEMQQARIKSVQEGMGGIRDVILDRAQPLYLDFFSRLDRKFRNAQAKSAFISVAPRFVVESAGMIIVALLALYLSTLPGGIFASLPALGALAIGAQRLLPLFQQAYTGWSSSMSNRAILNDVLALLELPREQREEHVEPLPFRREIVLADVSFSYNPSAGPAVRRLTISISRGMRVGFLGETGSGKSTLIDIIMGLLPPSEGHIAIDGHILTKADVQSWQANIAHVPQTIYLADTSVAENIAFGVPHEKIDMDRVRSVAQKARIAQHIERLPNGYANEVGERGMRLSGGQRQRIGIARALYKNSPVLVLDEATSALDDATEAAVMSAIEELGEERTVLIIAHRLTTLAKCDIVYRLEHGSIVASGAYEQVVLGQGLPA